VQAFRQAIVVANPISGSGRAPRCLEGIAAAVRSIAARVEVVVTGRPGDARDAVGELCGEGALALAVGGDGTFNEMLNGAPLETCTLGIIPAGTGNVLAKELGVSRRAARAVRQLLCGRVRRLDLGVCNGRRFASMFGAGVDARAVELVSRRRQGRLTQLHYVPHVVRASLWPPSRRIEVTLDGERFAEGAVQVSVGNTHSYGGPIEMTPAAAPDDGLLDVMALRAEGIGALAGLAAPALLHALHLSGRVRYGRGRRVVVRAPGTGVPYELDGDAAGRLPATVQVRPGAVRVLAPRSFRPARRRPDLHTRRTPEGR